MSSKDLNNFEFNEKLLFKIASGQLFYGSCLNPEEERPYLYLNLICQDYELERLIGKGSVVAWIHRHPNDRMAFGDETIAKGHFEADKEYVEIAGILQEHSFDAVANVLILNNIEILDRIYLFIGLNKPHNQIDWSSGKGILNETIYIELLGFRIEIGKQPNELDTQL